MAVGISAHAPLANSTIAVTLDVKKATKVAFFTNHLPHAENEEPQPQVEDAFGFLMTNCDPSRPSL